MDFYNKDTQIRMTGKISLMTGHLVGPGEKTGEFCGGAFFSEF